MPWYAQRADLPDTHKQWADRGSQHEAVLQRLGYVEVPAPGADPVDEPALPALVPAEAELASPPAKPRGKAR